MRYIYALAICLSISLEGIAQSQHTISGYIRDSNTGEEMIGATVVVVEMPGTGTVSNVYGYYSLTLPEGSYTLKFNFIGYEPIVRQIDLTRKIKLDINLAEENLRLDEIVIQSEKPEDNITDVKMSREKLQVEKIKTLPALFGEVDLVKTLQLLPGIQSAGEGTTGLFVRGGPADQNLILLDEATVYNAAHFLGFFSVFNADAIKNVEIYKGGIPARFGGRLSSILDIQMKEGNNKKFAMSGGLGTISSRLTLEGPIVKDKSSFIISGRRTYADMFLRLSPESGVSGAEVVISDNEGFSEVLEETEKGIYQTTDLQGKAGNTYTLQVRYEGTDYEATGTILEPPVFDSLTYRFVEETALKDEGYYLYFFGKTPKPGISYYRWLVYKNGELFNTEPEDFLLASDEFVNEELNDLEFPFAFQLQDTLRLEMYSLELSMFNYYNELLTILFNDGGLFSPPPVNPVSNIKNLTDPRKPPLGYFQASPVVAEEVVIQDDL